MDKSPSSETNNQPSAAPEPEALVARSDDNSAEAPTTPDAAASSGTPATPKSKRHRTYRPSHKATFIGLAVVVLILAINAGVLVFVLKGKNAGNNQNNDQVTISKAALSKAGVNTSTLGDSGVVLTIGPNTQFNNKVTVDGDVSIGGQLKLNSKFTASDASLTQLEAGKTSFNDLNVSGDGTLTNLNLRSGLSVTGASQLQGPVTLSQLLTVNNSVIVVGNLAVGGTLTTKTFSATSLTSSGALNIGGHVITSGLSPRVGAGGTALGNNGTVGISGNDAAGVISVNIGTGAATGNLANVAFHSQFSSTPHVVVTGVGMPCALYLTNLTAAGFSVSDTCNLSPGGYAIEYIIEQ